MRSLNLMIKPASSLCNLRCSYCFYADVARKRERPSFGIMPEETFEALLQNLFSGLLPGDTVNIAFQGGEPAAAGLPWFRKFTESVKKYRGKVNVNYAFQTNATLLHEEWYDWLKENRVLAGVSLDGNAALHDACRKDADGKGTYHTVMKAVRALQTRGIAFNILATLTNTAARYPDRMWRFITENGFRHVQFTPCLAPLDGKDVSVWALTPKRFASFYTRIFTLWKGEFEKGNYYSIKFFDDVVNLLAYGEASACGLNGKCAPQLVAEADGSVYPCDFYVLDEYRLGSLGDTEAAALLNCEKAELFRNRKRERTVCENCPYERLCAGGCPRMRDVMYIQGDFCGYREFLDSAGEELAKIAFRERQLRRV